jgi:exodeoxyribonuclease VII small subunit
MDESKSLRFEDALTRLEEIVKQLEAGDLDLETSLCLFEEGIRLSGVCSSMLDRAEKKIEQVSSGKDGEVILTPVNMEK